MSVLSANEKFVLALPKGRILKKVMELVRYGAIEPGKAIVHIGKLRK
ncbi:MAG: hypothetical protein V3R66_00245 [Rhodospirillales bacterium]